MLKSTKITLARQQNALKQQAKSNELKQQEIEETKRHNLVEEETKDRVEISKKEYLALLEQIETLKAELNHSKSIVEKMLKPITKAGISDNVYKKILANEFNVSVSTLDDIVSYSTKIAVIYEVPFDEFEEMER